MSENASTKQSRVSKQDLNKRCDVLRIKEDRLKDLVDFEFSRFSCEYCRHRILELSNIDRDFYEKHNTTPYYTGGAFVSVSYFTRAIMVMVEVYSYEEMVCTFASEDYEFYIKDLIDAGMVEKVEA